MHHTVADVGFDEDIADGFEAEVGVKPHQMLLGVDQEIVEACAPSVVDRSAHHAPPVGETSILSKHCEPLELRDGFLAISDGSPSRHGDRNVVCITDQVPAAIIVNIPFFLGIARLLDHKNLMTDRSGLLPLLVVFHGPDDKRTYVRSLSGGHSADGYYGLEINRGARSVLGRAMTSYASPIQFNTRFTGYGN